MNRKQPQPANALSAADERIAVILLDEGDEAELGAKTLPVFLQAWKQWTSKRITRELNLSGTVWQEEFFDHVLRSSESYSQKWDYVKEDPVRADLVKKSDEWPWQGEVESLTL